MLQDQTRFSKVVAQIYDAALEPAKWSPALHACCSLLDGVAMQVYAIENESRNCLFQIDHGLPEGYREEYARFFTRESERNKVHLARPDLDLSYDYMFFDDKQIDRSDCYRWRQNFGLRYYIGGPLLRHEDSMVIAALHRRKGQGHVTAADIATYRLLRGHLSQAVQIRSRLADLEISQRGAWEAIENSVVGVIALGRHGRVQRCNRVARHILEAEDGLLCAEGELKARRPIDNAALQRLIGSALNDPVERKGGNLAVARHDRHQPYSIIVAPIRKDTELEAFSGDQVLVLVSDPGQQTELPIDLLRRHYGLTKKQADLTILLVSGRPLAECAEELGIAEKTARRHLATIFSKTDLHRQVDLVRLVLSLPQQPPQPQD